ncbi:hypothetical protein GCM10010277_73730 [Streptomyces longisporoflavus]|uniref:hypothetical protein n=1 Tax=Streptomyces longisporoflavus TaxID=28044 RepID=UPI00167D1A9E|nr:hypothetical protein [Streptomyces longisporoflavus]GGV66104.1 hypothetical protein GCM10010277_73730 [Streptomyces longisporoflavus]
MTQLLRRDLRGRQGTAPSSVSMAVLWVEGFGLILSLPLFGVIPDATSVFVLPAVAVALFFVVALVSAVFVLPSVALGHWLAGWRGSGRRGWWVAGAALLVLVLVGGLSLLVVASCEGGSVFSSWRNSLDWLLYASVFYCISVPAVLAAHKVVVRTDEGYRVWPARQVLGYGSIALLVESLGVLWGLIVLG